MQPPEIVVLCPVGETACLYVNEVYVLAAADTGPVGPGGYAFAKEAHNPVFETIWHGLCTALKTGAVILHLPEGESPLDTIRANRRLREELTRSNRLRGR
jgi:hypothetical protein